MVNLPCLLLCYSRFEGFKRVFASCISNGIVDFYIAIDGPADAEVQIIQHKISDFIEAHVANDKINVKILKRKKNWGAAVSIVTAIDWFFEQVEFGCIFEDDLEIGNDFFEFARHNLVRFKDDDEVWMVSGNQFIDMKSSKIESNNYSNYPLIWGWAGWANSWRDMSKAIRSKKNFPTMLSFNKTQNFLQVGAARAFEGRIDAWDVPLAYEMWSLGKYALLPAVNLVSNIGSDEFAVHTKTDKFPLHSAIEKMASLNPNSTNKNKVARKVNRKIENQVFMVRKRHVFLPLWIFFKGELRKTKSITFENRIAYYAEIEN